MSGPRAQAASPWPDRRRVRVRRELMRNAIGLAYEYSARRLFYSDIQRGAINTVRFDGSDHRVLIDRTYRRRPLRAELKQRHSMIYSVFF